MDLSVHLIYINSKLMEDTQFLKCIETLQKKLEVARTSSGLMATILTRVTGSSFYPTGVICDGPVVTVQFSYSPMLASQDITILKRCLPEAEFFGSYVTIPLSAFFNF